MQGALVVAIPMNTHVIVLLIDGETVEGEVAMSDQTTYLCLRRANESFYLPWSAIKCVRGPALPGKGMAGSINPTRPTN